MLDLALPVKTGHRTILLSERGYRKEPASMAAATIGRVAERGIDVVLVDTAGLCKIMSHC
ncbi:hypothetical protein KIN20_035808 [Parelaphostrongylus tenuis]|uniref:SRP54-type proteins GTP-binding domain-containing protein n=1 Tax=Parelaphostrongylus tenuis TaxID=148309 RepID=A0AAD5WK86_PARTN|nr:hypothetical protein KIN20_035808 [Parelaphostrongylus tenuis]